MPLQITCLVNAYNNSLINGMVRWSYWSTMHFCILHRGNKPIYMYVFMHRIVAYVETVVHEPLAVDQALVGTWTTLSVTAVTSSATKASVVPSAARLTGISHSPRCFHAHNARGKWLLLVGVKRLASARFVANWPVTWPIASFPRDQVGKSAEYFVLMWYWLLWWVWKLNWYMLPQAPFSNAVFIHYDVVSLLGPTMSTAAHSARLGAVCISNNGIASCVPSMRLALPWLTLVLPGWLTHFSVATVKPASRRL